MQTKSEMINRIAELAEENAELKAKIKKYAAINEQETKDYAELKAENERLKEEKDGMQILIDNYITLTEKYYQTLQEIKTIAEKLMADNLCNNCDGIGLDANCQDTGCPYYQMDKILQTITKAEEE